MVGERNAFDQDRVAQLEKLQLVLQAAGIGVWEIDPTNLTVQADDRCRELYALPATGLVNYAQLLTHVHPADRERVQSAGQQALAGSSGGAFDIRFRINGLNGEPVRWVRSQGKVHFNEQGQAYRFLGMAEDVTKAVETQLQTQQLATIIEKTPYYVAITNLDGHIRYVNPFGRQLLGLDTEEVTRKQISDFFKPDDFQKVVGEVLPAVLAASQWEGHLAMSHLKTGESIPVETIAFSLTDSITGQPSALVALNRDLRPELAARQQRQLGLQQLQASEARFRSLIEEAPVATCLFVGRDLIIEVANKRILDIWGKGDGALGKPLAEVLPELTGQPFLQILDDAYTSGQLYQATADRCDLVIDGELQTFYFNFTYKPLLDKQGQVYAIMNMAVDVTEQVTIQHKLRASEASVRSVIKAAPAAMGLFVGRNLVIEMPNQAFIDIVGKGPDIEGKPLAEVMPELENQPFLQILDDVYTSGKMYQSYGAPVDIVQQGVMTHNFYNITYTPLFDSDGNVYAILDIAIDVTERIVAMQKIEASQLQLLALFEQSPVAIAIIREPDLTFWMVNPFYAELTGRTPDELVGRPLLEALPELRGQGFDILLKEVVATGVPYIAEEVPVNIVRHNQLETIYVNLTYQPQQETDRHTGLKRIIGILVVATDVTQQVLARQKVEESKEQLTMAARQQQRLINIMEASHEFIGLTDLDGRVQYANPAAKAMLGWDTVDGKTILDCVHPDDRATARTVLANLIKDGYASHDIRFMNTQTGKPFWLQWNNVAVRDTVSNDIVSLAMVSPNITERRESQQALRESEERYRTLSADLEEQVAHRTRELVARNAEYVSINEELEETNKLLVRSNDNLQQFAYVASHDLQEPLRKIQQFGDLLKNQFSDQVGDGLMYLERMQVAANRMSTLIRDLLSFSRISTQRKNTDFIPLNQVVNTILTDLELLIQETEAVVAVDPLPTIQGDQSQLEQLFQNLLSNALKFQQADSIPNIHVSSQQLPAAELPSFIQPSRSARHYHRIDIRDNGIGFDEKYLDRIFQVFQRLHGKSEFAGTGVGLAICEKVVANHDGAITATSQPGRGSTFSIYFPA
ncbi:PAS domain-containing sensor histidine kinase [Spirosoma aerophilum]